MSPSSTITYRGRTWTVKLRRDGLLLIEWYRPDKPRGATNYAIRWISEKQIVQSKR